MIKLWNVSGQLKSEIGSLVRFYSIKLKKSYSFFLGKGVFGKQLANNLNETIQIPAENLIDSNNLGVRKADGAADAPETYEAWLEKENAKKRNNRLDKMESMKYVYRP